MGNSPLPGDWEHKFCRTLLKMTLKEMRAPDPVRQLKTDIEGKVKIGNSTTYFVRVIDSRDPHSGTKFPSTDGPGHFRARTYEVDACCRYSARVEALNRHARLFDPEESP